jgi:hypothetical protein
MEKLFNDIYNNIIEEENKKEDICNICYYKTLNDKVELSCKHIYHGKCIKTSKFCPYCTISIKKIKILSSVVPSGVVPSGVVPSGVPSDVPNICKVILKSGKNKNKKCGRNNCKYHKINL